MTLRLTPLAAACSGVVLALGMVAAQAASVTIFTGADLLANGTVHADQPAAMERARFLAALDNSRTRNEDFEFFLKEPWAPLSLFGAIEPHLPKLEMPSPTVPDGSSGLIVAGPLNTGRFNTTDVGKQWWESSGDFSISFDVAIQAFGFFATDLGDFHATLLVEWFLDGKRGGTSSLGGETGGQDGSLHFLGLTDTGGFDLVSFTITQQAEEFKEFDFIGFDDLIAGSLRTDDPPPPNGVPEPLTLALVGLGLAGVALTRRRRG